ncbi:MAG TPA: PA0069 family radical SAM protein [Polyangia bacterium]|nr:PA0069 family radical SAM protein [Polyangia bacterium]
MRPVPISNPPNPWATTEVEYLEGAPEVKLQVFADGTRQILAKNDSPDVGFTYSVNPYRGCFHACAYCYARPSHEYLSMGAGTDFDRKIVVKLRAAELLRAAFAKKSWRRETVVFSGVTDCYQPLEASYRLTRACLEVCVAAANPAAIITKSALVERDVDVLGELARVASVFVTVSIPFWDPERARAIEPYVATPARRLRVIETLARAGLPVGVNVAPIIPGLNDQDIPKILAAARDAGATRAGCVLLRLPGSVKQVFEERLRAALPLTAERVLHRIRETRGGQLYDPRFGKRGRGEGTYAETIRSLFETTAARLGFERGMEMGDSAASGQTSGDVEDVKDDRQAAVAERVVGRRPQTQLTLGFEPGGRHDGGAPSPKVRP